METRAPSKKAKASSPPESPIEIWPETMEEGLKEMLQTVLESVDGIANILHRLEERMNELCWRVKKQEKVTKFLLSAMETQMA
ncbi:unnamed protein product [Lampetra planeri]